MLQEWQHRVVEKSTTSHMPAAARGPVFHDEELIQGKPVSSLPSAEGMEALFSSSSEATSGLRGRPADARSSEGSEQTNSCNRAPFFLSYFVEQQVCAHNLDKWVVNH